MRTTAPSRTSGNLRGNGVGPSAASVALSSQPLPLLSLPDGVSLWTGERLRELQLDSRAKRVSEDFQTSLFRTIDILGARSQTAQGVNAVLTSVARMRENKAFHLYLLTHDGRGCGILKVGVKKLFVTHPKTNTLVEVDPLCALDFFVDSTCQRKGFGKQLFEHMLQQEQVDRPELIAIDRPSPKFLAFLSRHYGLVAFTPQVNNFVVFHRFFDNTSLTERGRLIRTASHQTPAVDSRVKHLNGNPSTSARGAGGMRLLGLPSSPPQTSIAYSPEGTAVRHRSSSTDSCTADRMQVPLPHDANCMPLSGVNTPFQRVKPHPHLHKRLSAVARVAPLAVYPQGCGPTHSEETPSIHWEACERDGSGRHKPLHGGSEHAAPAGHRQGRCSALKMHVEQPMRVPHSKHFQGEIRTVPQRRSAAPLPTLGHRSCVDYNIISGLPS